MKERCWVKVHMRLICATAFIYFGDDGWKRYCEYLAENNVTHADINDIDGNSYSFRCWVGRELDLATIVHELNHVATEICKERDIETEEAHSYVLGYIFGEVLRKRRLTVSKKK